MDVDLLDEGRGYASKPEMGRGPEKLARKSVLFWSVENQLTGQFPIQADITAFSIPLEEVSPIAASVTSERSAFPDVS